jgi:uncharacterized repeat protein (TIGR01451 family)
MTAAKSADKSIARVGDFITYTITVGNEINATAILRNVALSDTISEYMSFIPESVQLDGATSQYSYNDTNRLLYVQAGNISAGQTKTITFAAMVNSTAYGKTFKNTAIFTADNNTDRTATDNGVTIENGTADGSAGAKTVSSPAAKIGDTLTYTIMLRNSATATDSWENITVTDTIPEYLSFISGSVEENGHASANAAYNAETKTMNLFASSIAPGETKIFTFKAEV